MSSKHTWRCGACGTEQTQIVAGSEFELHERITQKAENIQRLTADRALLMELCGLTEDDFETVRRLIHHAKSRAASRIGGHHAVAG